MREVRVMPNGLIVDCKGDTDSTSYIMAIDCQNECPHFNGFNYNNSGYFVVKCNYKKKTKKDKIIMIIHKCCKQSGDLRFPNMVKIADEILAIMDDDNADSETEK